MADELSGLLQSLDTQGQEAARGFYLSGWGGQGSYTFDRITRESVRLSRYQLAVFGGFQPDRIKAYVKQSQGGSSKNDGLMQRFQLLVWPDVNEQFALVDRPANRAALTLMENAIANLVEVAKHQLISNSIRKEGVCLLHFDQAAQIKFNAWYTQNEQDLRSGDNDSAIHGHFSKYRSLIPGLALLFHLLDNSEGPVSVQSLDLALQFSEYLKSHAKRIYASVHSQDYAAAKSLADRLLSKDIDSGFTKRTLQHKGWRNLAKSEQAESALDTLVEFGWLHEEPSTGTGRHTIKYKINPRIYEEWG